MQDFRDTVPFLTFMARAIIVPHIQKKKKKDTLLENLAYNTLDSY